ncbi:TIM-barrel domain-containing protein [Longitalea luteola]|uniref:TIM-barrel domain-containing protein n=1 Tax=Longitalea luteola TaxID=2812563 RepID=UPI001A96FFB6|nr:TIM-barrel domain-containing protein [Longitalea luteola]
MEMLKRSFCGINLLLITGLLQAQQAIINTVGKDPFVGKTTEVIYKAKEGTWTFQGFNNTVIRTTYKPADYNKNEQVSDAVIAKPPAVTTKITNAVSQTVEFENLTSVVVQREKFYYKTGKEVKVKSAAYFTQGDTRGFRFQLFENEQIFGGGERALPMNRRGHRVNLYNAPVYGYGLGAENLNFSVPFFISSAGYALFFDNPSKGYVDIGLTDKNTLEAGFTSGELTYYVVFGRNLDEIMTNYTSITGRQPLPPRWVFGNFVSRFGYRSEEQVKQVVGKMKQDHFPMDGLVFDLFWFGDAVKGTMGNLDWVNTQKWPNPKQMLTDFKTKDHLKSILVTEPYILQNTKTYAEATPFLATGANGSAMMIPDLYFGTGGLVDIFRKQSQDWIWKYYKKQIGNGVSGWWLDLAEPEKHPAGMVHNLKDYGVARPMGGDEVHNVYAHYFSKMFFEKYSSDVSDQRLVLLNRSGFAGSQRYGVLPSTGDVARSWSGLKAQPLLLLGMSLSGLPYTHSDAGGLAATEQADPELYTRWLQFAAFTPVFRPHGTALEDLDKSIKSIPSEPCFWDEPHKSIVRNYIKLRYQLLPYNYSLSYDQAVLGKPLMRPLYYYSFADSSALRAEDEYFWGDNILVAPVTSQGATSRMLYLPAGKWYSLLNNSVTDGGKWITQPADIKQIPVFVKEGSFVPMWITKDTIKSTEAYNSKDITVRYYPSANSSTYVWYDDDGVSTRTLEKADYELVTFKGVTAGNKVTIDITTNNPNQYGKKFKRKFNIELPVALAAGQPATVNGKPVGAAAKQQDPFQQITNEYVTVEFTGKPVKVEITLGK